MSKISFFWFRRDLRLEDNAGLYHALRSGKNIQPIFIFDTNILDKLQDKQDARVNFIHSVLAALKQQLAEYHADLWVYHGDPLQVWHELNKKHDIESVYTNRDYESYALSRDQLVADLLHKHNINFHTFKDHVIFEHNEVLKDDGLPYTVFTPYKRKWLKKIDENPQKWVTSFYFKSYPTLKYQDSFNMVKPQKMMSLQDIGFLPSGIDIPSNQVNRSIIKKYEEQRNFPAINGTSRLGIHFRFGTISIREKARNALGLSETYLSELVWRDFYSQILRNFPHVEENAFRAKYERVNWINDETHFEKWCAGKTGYPLVDAGMRELNETGHMHNRVRMVVASFLTKHLLTDWRRGESYFAAKLLDFDLASNNGGWQWAAGCGTDAAPYFRIFNPTSQLTKFDKNLVYVKKWVPEYGTSEYPDPIIDHKFARERCLAAYKEALSFDS